VQVQLAAPATYTNYNPFMPSSIGVATPAPYDLTYAVPGAPYAGHVQEPWFAAATASAPFAGDRFPEVGVLQRQFAEGDYHQLAMQSRLLDSGQMYYPDAHTAGGMAYPPVTTPTPGQPPSWANYRGQGWPQ
jgi:hypothetical protein